MALSTFELIGFGDGGWGPRFVSGTILTLEISAASYAIGAVFGFAGAWLKLSGGFFRRLLGDGYTTVIRAVPELLIIILLYYTGTQAIASLLGEMGVGGDIEIDPFAAAVVTLGFVQGAYQTEVFRGAVQAIPRGVNEAGRALALTGSQRFRLITLPMGLRFALPGLTNLWLNVLKDSSLISVVGFSELLFTGKTAAAATKQYFIFFLVTAAIFLVLTIISSALIRLLRLRVERGMVRG